MHHSLKAFRMPTAHRARATVLLHNRPHSLKTSQENNNMQGNRPSLLFLKPNSVKTFLESCFSQGNKSTPCLSLYRCHGLKDSQGVCYSKDHRSIRRLEATQGNKKQTPDRKPRPAITRYSQMIRGKHKTIRNMKIH